uniref:Uncharacterized protein n=1 Tax=Gopherus agassizii TaxID=38772 RepID=A0A452GF51_9SAUR
MYAKGKGSAVPSDSQAREKLALYVYEYLLHVGAQKSAQTFLSEVRLGWPLAGGRLRTPGRAHVQGSSLSFPRSLTGLGVEPGLVLGCSDGLGLVARSSHPHLLSCPRPVLLVCTMTK